MKYEVTMKFLIPKEELKRELSYMEEQIENDWGLKKGTDYWIDLIQSNYKDEIIAKQKVKPLEKLDSDFDNPTYK